MILTRDPKRIAFVTAIILSLFFIMPSVKGATIELKHYPSDSIIDIRVYDADGDGATQIRFGGLDSIPAGQIINDAELAFYPYECYGAMDNDITVWRVDDQTWDNTINTATYNAQSIDNQIDGTMNSTGCTAYTAVSVTQIVQADYDDGNNYTSFRFEDPDDTMGASTSITDGAEDVMGDYPIDADGYWKINSNDGTGGTNIPALKITYSEAPPTPYTLNISNPTNTTYWNLDFNFDFNASHSVDATFKLKAWHNGSLVYTNDAYPNATLISVNITENITRGGIQNLTVWMQDSSLTNNTESVYMTVADWELSNVSYHQWVQEFIDTEYNVTIKGNFDLIANVKAGLWWNDTFLEWEQDIYNNNTHTIVQLNNTIGLIAKNFTNATWNLQMVYIYHPQDLGDALAGHNTTEYTSNYTQNITYAVYISSLVTDSSYYLTGENITVDLYIKNDTNAPSINSNISFYKNSTYNLTRNIAGFDLIGGLREYETQFQSGYNDLTAEIRNITANITVSYGGRSRQMNTQVGANVYKFQVTDCTALGNATLTIRFYNETDFLEKKGMFDLIHFKLTSGDISEEYSFYNATENETYTFCLFPYWAEVETDIYLEYGASDSPERPYYANNVILSDTLQYLDAYILNNTFAYYTNIFVYDENSNKLPNVYVRVLKMNPDTTTYETMFIGKTDVEGILDTFLEPLTQPYIFYVVDADGDILFSTEADTIPCVSGSCPPYEKHIYIFPDITGYIEFGDITWSLDWDNSTRTLTIEVSDESGLVQSIKINIWEMNDFGKRTSYYSNEVDSATIYYSAILPNTTSEYFVEVAVMEYDSWYNIISESLLIDRVMVLGALGIIVAFLIITGAEIAGIYVLEGIGALIGGALGIGASWAFQLIPLNIAGLMAIYVVFGIIAWAYLSERRR